MNPKTTYALFSGAEPITRGYLEPLVGELHAYRAAHPEAALLVFEETSGVQLDFDLRGTAEQAIGRLATHPYFAPKPAEPARPGRPKLGVVSREISLLPRHWEWLEAQKGGASASIRRLVDAARAADPGSEQKRLAWTALGKVLWAVAGNLPGFEEASRALYAHDAAGLTERIQGWPAPLRAWVTGRLAEMA